MDPKTVFAEVRRLIIKAKNEEAAEHLLAFLEQNADVSEGWKDTIRNILAQYQRIRLKEQKGVISHDNALSSINQITNALLESVGDIESGKDAPKNDVFNNDEISSQRKTPWMVIGVVIALILAGASFLMLRRMNVKPEKPILREPSGPTVPATGKEECPAYPQRSQFNIMVLPYQPLGGEQKRVENALRIRLAEKMEDFEIAGSVLTCAIDVNSDEYPVTNRQAAAIGEPCNAQLVIWGTTEEQGEGTGLITTTKFRFIDSEHFTLAELELDNTASVDTVSSISSIATSAELTEDIEKTIALIFSLVTYEMEEYKLAADLFEEVIEDRGGADAVPNWGHIQADCYIKSGQDERAIQVYEKVLQRDSTNVQAWTNKGLLEYKKGEINAAGRDFNRALSYDASNPKALTARAAVNVQKDNLYEARKDLDQLKEMEVKSKGAQSINKAYRAKHKEEMRKLDKAEQELEQDPKDTAALRVQAETAKNLGQFKIAGKAASTLLEIDPSNQAAKATIVKILPLMSDSLRLMKYLQTINSTITPEQLKLMNQKVVRPLN